MPNLLIVFHSQSGSNAQLAQAALRGARRETDVATRILRAGEATTDDLLWADGILFGSAENFGYLSGALTDFLARTFYPYQHTAPGRVLPYAMFSSTGNDGRGAVRQLQRIVSGYPMREVAEAVIVRGDIDEGGLHRCEELGQTLAAGLSLGMF